MTTVHALLQWSRSMPVYEYECNGCQKVFEVHQRIADSPLAACPDCKGSVRKLVSMSSFQLKGGGWYADGYASHDAKSKSNGESKPAAPACPAASKACSECPAAASDS
jgi:putative FmdB family regulatory protein